MDKKESKTIKKKTTRKKSRAKKAIYILIAVAIILIIILCLLFDGSTGNGNWVRKGNKIINGMKSYAIGDYYEYDETNGGSISGLDDVKWRVMNVDKDGNLLIISDLPVEELTLGSENDLEKAKEDYVIGEEKMNDICKKYSKGKEAIDGRCIANQDIVDTFNLKTDELPLMAEEFLYLWGLESNLVAIDQYHEKFVSPTHGDGFFLWFNEEKNEWEKSIASSESTNDDLARIVSLKGNLLTLNGIAFDEKYFENFTEQGEYLGTDPKMDMFFSKSLNEAVTYWTTDRLMFTQTNFVGYGFNVVKGFDINYDYVVYSNGLTRENTYGVRPVVVIK